MDISKALEYGAGEKTWSVGETYESLDWAEGQGSKPSPEQVEDWWNAYVSEREANAYKHLRKEAILTAWPVTAQLEAMTEAQMGNSTKLNLMLEDIAAIKSRYPEGN